MLSQHSRLCNSEFRSILFGANYKTTHELLSVSVFIFQCVYVSMGVCVYVLPSRQTILLEYKKCENFSAIIVVFVTAATAAAVVRVIIVENLLQANALFLHSRSTLSTYFSHFFAKYQQSLKLMTLIIMSDTSIDIAVGSRFPFPKAHSSQFNVGVFWRTVCFTVIGKISATSRFKI